MVTRWVTRVWTGRGRAAISGSMTEDLTLDARGLLCPLPVLKLRKRLKSLNSGDIVALWADDPAAIVDVPHFCNEAGHALLDVQENEAAAIYRVQKG